VIGEHIIVECKTSYQLPRSALVLAVVVVKVKRKQARKVPAVAGAVVLQFNPWLFLW